MKSGRQESREMKTFQKSVVLWKFDLRTWGLLSSVTYLGMVVRGVGLWLVVGGVVLGLVVSGGGSGT